MNTNENKRTLRILYAIMLKEVEKPYTEMDADLVSECVDYIMEIKGIKHLSQEQIDAAISSLFKREAV